MRIENEYNNFDITSFQEGGTINSDELEMILRNMPISFRCLDEKSLERIGPHDKAVMNVEYYGAQVVSIYPQSGKRLSCATVTNKDFLLNPDNIMDDNIRLRCCFHPKIESFGVEKLQGSKFRGEVEIDIYKFSKDRKYKESYEFAD